MREKNEVPFRSAKYSKRGGLLYFAERNGTLKNIVRRAEKHWKHTQIAKNASNTSIFDQKSLKSTSYDISEICSFFTVIRIWQRSPSENKLK